MTKVFRYRRAYLTIGTTCVTLAAMGKLLSDIFRWLAERETPKITTIGEIYTVLSLLLLGGVMLVLESRLRPENSDRLLKILAPFTAYFALAVLLISPHSAASSFYLAFGLSLVSGIAFRKRVRWLIGLFLFLAMLAFGWVGNYEQKFGPLSDDSFLALFQADQTEVFTYAPEFFDLGTFVFSSLIALLFVLVPSRIEGFGIIASLFRIGGLRRVMSLTLALYLGGNFVLGAIPFARVSWSALHARENFREQVVAQQALFQSEAKFDKSDEARAKFKGQIVVLIGESTNRHHMSVYDYHRETTPNLRRLSLESRILLNTDAISQHSHTVPSLTPVLSYPGNGPDSTTPFDRTLPVELRKNGFKTFWFSNQNEYGVWDNPISLIGKQATISQFLRPSFGIEYRRGYYDGALINKLKEAIRDPAQSKVIFLHLYATHGPYCRMIPSASRSFLSASHGLGEKFFGKATDFSTKTNCYDNAVAYVDSVINQAITLCAESETPTVLTYFSDHGEAPTLGTSHDHALPSAHKVEIPLIWYFNERAKVTLAAPLSNLKANLESPFLLSDMYHSLSHLVGITSSGVEVSKSLFSRAYRPSRRLIMTSRESPGFDYDDVKSLTGKDYLEISRSHLKHLEKSNVASRVWAHRVNTLGKLWEAKMMFHGVELDVVFDPNQKEFFVYHPPAANLGLSLREYLEAASTKPNLQFWLDWKNADSPLLGPAIARLAELDRIFSLRRRTIIETGHQALSPALKTISGLGFLHSYYLPTESAIACATDRGSDRCRLLGEKLIQNVKDIGAQAISFDLRALDFVRKRKEVFSGLRWLSWDTNLDIGRGSFLGEVPKMDDLAVLLVKFPSAFSDGPPLLERWISRVQRAIDSFMGKVPHRA